jgi:hypothetical protein
MRVSIRSACAYLGASLLVGIAVGLSGCDAALAPVSSLNAVGLTGNWQFASTAAAASKLPEISGELTGNSQAMTGIFHSDSLSACVVPSAAFEVAGAANGAGLVTLTGANVGGGKLTITGTLAADGKSLTDASYNVVGGPCAFAQAASAQAQQYSAVSGTYAGSFSDSDGQVITLSATLTQTPNADTDGNFQLSGTGTFPNNPCFASPVTMTSSQVTGGSFTFTYTDPTTQNEVVTNGALSTDGKTLTVTGWTLTGSCGPDHGTGLLMQQ